MTSNHGDASIYQRLCDLASAPRKGAALVQVENDGSTRSMTAAELVEEVWTLSRALAAEVDDRSGSTVACVEATNTIDCAVTILAALCAGITIFPHSSRFDAALLADVLQGVGVREEAKAIRLETHRTRRRGAFHHVRLAYGAVLDRSPTYFLATSGSTGTPKMIPFWNYTVYDRRAAPDALFRSCAWKDSQKQLIALPIYHIGPFSALVQGILSGNQLIIGNGLTTEGVLRAIEEQEPEWTIFAPRLMEEAVAALADRPQLFDSLRAVVHTALPCPAAVKWAWIDMLGPDRIYELYGGTEGVGATLIRGSQWVAHPGSVGRGLLTRLRVLDEDGCDVPRGELGQVFMRRLGAAPEQTAALPWLTVRDGYASLGDMGWIDEDGYLYLFDRVANRVATESGVGWLGRTSLVVRAHRGVADAECLAVGSADEMSLKAFVVPRADTGFDVAELREHCVRHLAPHERPHDFVVVQAIPRSEIGKLDRTALRSLEVNSAPPAVE